MTNFIGQIVGKVFHANGETDSLYRIEPNNNEKFIRIENRRLEDGSMKEYTSEVGRRCANDICFEYFKKEVSQCWGEFGFSVGYKNEWHYGLSNL
jgi:hypothetical protein